MKSTENGIPETNINSIRDEAGNTLLHLAAKYGHHDVVRFLIENGADFDAINKENQKPLNVVVQNGQSEDSEIVKTLHKYESKEERLFLWSKTGLLSKIESLDVQGVRIVEVVNKRDAHGSTPLIYAAKSGHLEVVEFLIKNGADVNVLEGVEPSDSQSYGESNKCCNALYYAMKYGHRQTAVVLIENNARIDFRGDVNINLPNKTTKRTLMHHAASCGRLIAVKFLIMNGGNFAAKDDAAQTPLHLAAASGHWEVADLLIKSGADPNVTDAAGQTPLDVAKKNGHEHMVRLLSANLEGGRHEMDMDVDSICTSLKRCHTSSVETSNAKRK